MGEKLTRFRDIPKLISCHHGVDYEFDFLVKQVRHWMVPKEGGLQLTPDFQRGHVWTREQQIAYVEYLLRGGISGRNLYFNYPSWHTEVASGEYNDFVIVDGLQRYTAIAGFLADEFPVFGSCYSEFTDSWRPSNTIRVHINDLKSKVDVLEWYLQMNAGGTPHSKSEIERVYALLDTERRASSCRPAK